MRGNPNAAVSNRVDEFFFGAGWPPHPNIPHDRRDSQARGQGWNEIKGVCTLGKP
jgi:hypothetical protein